MMSAKTSTAAMPALSTPQLPAPSPEALAHSARLSTQIRDAIAAAEGWIAFPRYMALALYAPGLGYYAGGAAKFGGAGDFVTAPELTPLFGRTLARPIADSLAQTGGDLLELGAGSGRLAVEVLHELERLHALPPHYFILEISPDLRARQQALLAAEIPHLYSRVIWLDALPGTLRGVVLANEVLDALPAHLIHWTAHGPMERGVALDPENGAFVWADRAIREPALAAAAAALPITPPYLSEINLAANALVASLSERLQAGMMLFLDYGFARHEFYHPQRHTGTLKVHYRHHSLDDPFFLPGLADITTHVDFTAIATVAESHGLTVRAFSSQGRFLLDAGLLDQLAMLTPGTREYMQAVVAVQKLVQPHEMGELFKVVALGRDVDSPTGG